MLEDFTNVTVALGVFWQSENMSSAENQQERLLSEERKRWFLAGVIEGEGSVSVSVRRHPTAAFGYYVQPMFFIYQHRVRRALLEMAMDYFEHGRIRPKPGNPDVLVFSIQSRPVLRERVVPLLLDCEGLSARMADFHKFANVLRCFDEGVHKERSGLARIVEIAYSMNSNGKWRKQPIEPILNRILRGHTPDTPSRGEDMVRSPWRRGELDGTETV